MYKQRTEHELREALSRFCHAGRPRPGERSVMSIPMNREFDADMILADGIDELVVLRAELAARDQQIAQLRKALEVCYQQLDNLHGRYLLNNMGEGHITMNLSSALDIAEAALGVVAGGGGDTL